MSDALIIAALPRTEPAYLAVRDMIETRASRRLIEPDRAREALNHHAQDLASCHPDLIVITMKKIADLAAAIRTAEAFKEEAA